MGTAAELAVEYAEPPTRGRRRAPTARALGLFLACAIGLAVAVHGEALYVDDVRDLLASIRAEIDLRTLLLLALVYAVALALPFVPGLELGLLLMLALGPRGVVLVYAASLLGLSLSYAAGRVLPMRATAWTSWRRDPTAARAGTTGSLHALVAAGRVRGCVPNRLTGWLAGHPYLALAICLNLPGNAVVGGGGGIALLCGLSGRYSYRRYLATVAVAISPLPILLLSSSLGLDLAGV